MGPRRRVAHVGSPKVPQTAYAGLAKLLQQEWQCLRRVVLNCGAAFEPVKEAIRLVFLPALLQATEAECQRELTTVSVRKAGQGLPDPTQLAPGVRSLREGTALNANMHGRHAGLKRRLTQKKREAADEQIFAQLSWPPPTLRPSVGCSVPRRLGRGSPPCPIASMSRSSQRTSSETAFGCASDSLRSASLTDAMAAAIASR
jgi:hypothetical protein